MKTFLISSKLKLNPKDFETKPHSLIEVDDINDFRRINFKPKLKRKVTLRLNEKKINQLYELLDYTLLHIQTVETQILEKDYLYQHALDFQKMLESKSKLKLPKD